MSNDEMRIAASLVAERNGLAREWDWELLGAAENLAAAWLAEYPDDDDEPITAENVGSLTQMVTLDCEMFVLWMGRCWSLYMQPLGSGTHIFLRHVATRGDVRAFLRGMGIDTKGGE